MKSVVLLLTSQSPDSNSLVPAHSLLEPTVLSFRLSYLKNGLNLRTLIACYKREEKNKQSHCYKQVYNYTLFPKP